MAKPELLRAVAAAEIEVKLWEREARKQRRQLGYVPHSVTVKTGEAREVLLKARQAAHADDVAHMGQTAADALQARDKPQNVPALNPVLRTLARVEGLADEAAKPHRNSLPGHVLMQLELGAIAQWVYSQDEGTNAGRIVEIARQAVSNVHSKYNRS